MLVPEDVAKNGGKVTLQSKAMDANCNVQPEKVESVWNLRGLCYNAWGTATVRVLKPEEGQ